MEFCTIMLNYICKVYNANLKTKYWLLQMYLHFEGFGQCEAERALFKFLRVCVSELEFSFIFRDKVLGKGVSYLSFLLVMFS